MPERQVPGWNVDAVLGELLRRSRTGLGWTLQQFADKVRLASAGEIRLDPSAVSRIEQGKRSVSFHDAVVMLTIMDVDIDELVTMLGDSRVMATQRLRVNTALARIESGLAELQAMRAEIDHEAPGGQDSTDTEVLLVLLNETNSSRMVEVDQMTRAFHDWMQDKAGSLQDALSQADITPAEEQKSGQEAHR